MLPTPTRSRRLALSLAAALLLPLSGCLGATDTTDFQLNFGWQLSEDPIPAPGEEVPFIVTAGVRSLSVNGTFVLPCTPGRWVPSMDVSGGQINLHVEYREDIGCVAPAARVTYTAALLNLREGSYRLIVQHLNDLHTTPNATVVDQTVTVGQFTPQP